MKIVCPKCGGHLIARMVVDYDCKIDPETGDIAKRGTRMGDDIAHVRCGKCGAYRDELTGRFYMYRSPGAARPKE